MEHQAFEFALRAALIAAAAALVLFALRIRRAAAQHAVWTGVLLAMLALPAWLSWGPKAVLPLLPTPSGVLPVPPADPPASAKPLAVLTRIEPASPLQRASRSNADWPWIGVYLIGAGVLLLRLMIGTIRAGRLTGDACIVPMTVGLLRPRIILPNNRNEWPRAQLSVVLAHEGAHVRRRDPLIQWLARFNRAVFWFHPLAWWLEKRLSALAEEACDATVLEQGYDARDYSEYLLELARVVQRSGMRVNVTGLAMPGSYLPRRIKKIVANMPAPRVSRTRAACAAVACGICSATFAAVSLQQAPAVGDKSTTFEAASVKPAKAPDGVTITGQKTPVRKGRGIQIPRNTGGPGTDDPGRIHFPLISLKGLLVKGWDSYFEIKGPGWLDDDIVAVDATMPPDTTKEQFQTMFRNLIVERFNLKYHIETKEITGYALNIAKNGLKIRESPNQNEASPDVPRERPQARDADGFLIPPPRPGPWLAMMSTQDNRSRIEAHQQTMQDLTRNLTHLLNTTVTDATGLTAKYDFTVTYGGGLGQVGALPATPSDSAEPLPDIFAALQSQLGLKLESKKVSVEIMVVDHMEKTPIGN